MTVYMYVVIIKIIFGLTIITRGYDIINSSSYLCILYVPFLKQIANITPATIILYKRDRREKTKVVMMRLSLVDCQLVSHVSIDIIEVAMCSVFS